MAIEGLRYALLKGRIATIAWVAVGACFDATTHTVSPLPNASLGIHRPGS